METARWLWHFALRNEVMKEKGAANMLRGVLNVPYVSIRQGRV
jgi:hypothetical protein